MKYSFKRACLRHLQDTFGLTDYRPGQKAAVHALLSGRDVMCILPTGAGKSLCWQLPAVVHEGLTVVVSPLISLMRDQVQHLAAASIPAVSLDSLMSPEERAEALASIRQGTVRIAFVSPERLEHWQFRRLCCEVQPWMVVVDEAHCIVQWGEHFRPAYAKINAFLRMLPKRPVLCALTATADKTMQRAISQSLGMRREKRVLLPIIRENLAYETRTTLDRMGCILRLCTETPCKTVIFCATRAGAEKLTAALRSCGVSAEYYHAGMDRAARIGIQEWFRSSGKGVLCATSAFGMGVDIPDIRRVIHDHLLDDLVDYVQQSGRAGRDGLPAACILFFEPSDLILKTKMRSEARHLLRGHPIRRKLYLLRYWRKLEQLMKVLFTSACIPAGIASALGSRAHACGQCSACQRGKLIRRVPRLSRMSESRMRLWFLCWQRGALADKRHCRPGEIVPDAALQVAAKRFVFPEGVTAPTELERMIQYFRGERMHASDRNRV